MLKAIGYATLVCIQIWLSPGRAADLSQAPSRGAAPLPPSASTDSELTLVAFVPYEPLMRAGDAAIPASIPLSGDGNVACLDIPHLNPGHDGHHTECTSILGRRVCADVPDFTAPSLDTSQQCADYHWSANVTKDGPLALSQAGTALRVAQGLAITGNAGLGGDLASVLSLSAKAFEIRLVPTVDLNLDMDNRWCPVVRAATIGRWVESADVEIVGENCLDVDLGPFGQRHLCAGPVDLHIADLLNDVLNEHRDEMVQAATSAVPCDEIRSTIAAVWHATSIPIELADGIPLYLNIVPTAAAFSGLLAETEGVKLVVQVEAKTTIEASPVPNSAAPLPPLDRASADRGHLNLNVQVTAPYSLVKGELSKELKDHDFTLQTSVGEAKVHIEDADLYPSNTALVVGLKIDAKLPGLPVHTTGWVYLSGQPAIDGSGTAIVVKDLAFTSALDSGFWNLAEKLFETKILAELNAHSRFDLTAQIDDLSARISTAIANASLPGVRLSADKPTIALTGVSIGQNELVASASLSMSFDTHLTSPLIGN